MSRGSGLAKITNLPYKRIIPHQCPGCQHFNANRVEGWWVCDLKERLLSNPHTNKGNCKEYAPSGTLKIAQDLIDTLVRDANEHQAYRQLRKPGLFR